MIWHLSFGSSKTKRCPVLNRFWNMMLVRKRLSRGETRVAAGAVKEAMAYAEFRGLNRAEGIAGYPYNLQFSVHACPYHHNPSSAEE